ncbi:hypothetical protein VNO77_00588 [Canavalia gladiata]|uniref:C2 domain-containing protein n=1 Tax=Canavalia gladiata TaxID=3824 RepID=A0AAN9MPN7_CANGL
MPQGSLEVNLVNAKGLENTDYLFNMDPYVILTCRTQKQQSSVASGKGSDPEWNENFVFNVSEGVTELKLKIMDSDTGTAHDFVGEVTISLDALFTEGSIPPTSYNVVKDGQYRGEIKVGLTFTPQDRREREIENFGGWKESALYLHLIERQAGFSKAILKPTTCIYDMILRHGVVYAESKCELMPSIEFAEEERNNTTLTK